MSKVVFLVPGGLGDMAPTTTLAERLWREKRTEFYYRVGPRNGQILEFWTRGNEFLRGVENYEQPTHNAEFGPKHDELLQRFGSNVMAHEYMVGLEPRSTLPRIYWQPHYDQKWQGKVLVSAASVTVPFSRETFEHYITWLQNRKAFTRDQLVLILPPSVDLISRFPEDVLPDIPRWQPADIFEKASALHSCEAFVCTESGDAAMGSAINARTGYPPVLAVSSTGTFNREEFRWPNVRYHCASNVREDWI